MDRIVVSRIDLRGDLVVSHYDVGDSAVVSHLDRKIRKSKDTR